VHRAERDERVVDAVARQDRERPRRPEPAIEQRLADRARGLERLGVGDPAPGIAATAAAATAAAAAAAPPSGQRSARNVRAGASRAQRTSQSPTQRAWAGAAARDRSTKPPPGRGVRSMSTGAKRSMTGEHTARGAGPSAAAAQRVSPPARRPMRTG
jgi:hypothetical protein